MSVKLDVETNRIKGLCFHPQRTWLLASFFSGEIVIYDYEAGVTLQRYSDHASPVRSVDFHPIQPLFCSGSDDCTVRVFNYEKQRCLVTFKDHIDYVRTVQFHPVHPFIVSSSDDMTIRIWNWETRTAVTTIPGHNHYVMSAFFHPTMPWIISASLDDSVRVWDVSALFNDSQPSGIFSLTDVVIKFQQEEHSAGVNWASWHPTRQLAVSCSDDQTIKIWKINETDMSVIATLRSHTGNVSSAIYHPMVDVVLSCSEDNTVRIWDSKRFVHLAKFKKPDSRFWCLAAHPTLPLFAAGHDGGFIIYRLMRQRPTFALNGSDIYYYKENSIRKYNVDSQTDCVVGITKPRSSGNRMSPLDPPPSNFSYNQSQNKLLVGFQDKFELHQLGGAGTSEIRVENGTNPIWINRNQYAFLNPENRSQLNVREANGSTVISINIPETRRIFPASPSNVYLATEESVILFDVTRHREAAKRSIAYVKLASISPDRRKVAFISNNTVTIASIDLSKASTFHDGSKIKSGIWKENFFIYTTKTHIKYFLPNGDNGIIRSISFRGYIANVLDKALICMTTESEVRRLEVDLTECRFKTALEEGNMQKVTSILKTAKLCSESIIDYLVNKGHPEVAIVFVKDPLSRFRLGLASGDLKVAVEAAAQLNDPAIWESLADEALLHGRFSVAEIALQRSGNSERLAFFYLISGQKEKMNSIRCDDNAALQLQRAIWTNDRETVGNLLKDSAPPLSHIALREKETEESDIPETVLKTCKSLGKPDLVDRSVSSGSSEDWPLLFVSQPTIDISGPAGGNDEDEDIGAGWDDDVDEIDLGQASTANDGIRQKDAADDDKNEDDGWGLDDDLGDIDDQLADAAAGKVYLPPSEGASQYSIWTESSNVAGEVAAAGMFGQALDLLHDQIALINAEPLRNAFVTCFVAANASVPSFASCSPMVAPLSQRFADRMSVPMLPNLLENLRNKVNLGYVEFTKANFEASLQNFLQVIQTIPLVVCNTIEEQNEVTNHLSTCRNYITAIILESAISSNSSDKVRQLELAAYFTHCQLQQKHVSLTLKKAMTIAFKEKNFALVLEFGTRLSKIANLPEKVQKMMALSQAQVSKQPQQKINYDPKNPFDICSASLTPIYRGSQKVVCPFCGACYAPKFNGSKCAICQLSKVGATEASGLKLLRSKH